MRVWRIDRGQIVNQEVVEYVIGGEFRGTNKRSCYSARMWTDFRVRVSGLE